MKPLKTQKETKPIKKELETPLLEEMFEKYWYAAKSGLNQNKATLDHYLNNKKYWNISPSPYFDANFYLLKYKDVAAAKISPYLHFCKYGHLEGRAPNPFMDSKWYIETHSIKKGDSYFKDFLNKSVENTVDPVISFDSKWYAQNYKVSGSAFYHFLVHGKDNGFKPNPIFHSEYLWQQIKHLNLGIDAQDIYEKYLTSNELHNYTFCVLFNVPYFRKNYQKVYGKVSDNPLHDFLKSDSRLNPSIIFDRKFYRLNNDANYSNEMCDYYSREFHKRPSVNFLFDVKAYYNLRPDVIKHYMDRPNILRLDATEHYVIHGHKETNITLGSFFDHNFYKKNYLKTNDIDPLSHYLEQGINKGNLPRKREPLILEASRIKAKNASIINPISYSESTSASLTKGLFIHVYYTDLVEELILLANNVPSPTKIYISTDSQIKAVQIEKILEAISQHQYEIRVIENRGRDIAPFLVGYADRIKEVEIGCHLHTKKSPHSETMDSWKDYLFYQNMGSREIVSSILKYFDDTSIGMVAPVDHSPVEQLIQWGGNLKLVSLIVNKCTNNKYTVGKETPLELPSGSMFWFRSKALAPLLNLNLTTSAFDPEMGQIDGTLAHALERSFFYIAEIAGYKWLRTLTTSNQKTKKSYLEMHDSVNSLLPKNSANNSILASIPEVRNFSLKVDSSDRKRINLLIPTSDKSVGYAGVSEALRIFLGSLVQMDDTKIDCRIIDTDIGLSNQYSPPDGFTIGELDDLNQEGNLIIDGTNRAYKHLSIRKNDVFFASAWWTAQIARDILKGKNDIFEIENSKFLYIIQDYESCFYPWSTKFMLAEDTYKNNSDTIPIFNTSILYDFFVQKGSYKDGIIYNPPMNERLAENLDYSLERENKVLIYMRPHAERNCLSFAERIVEILFEDDLLFWTNWKFYAVGQNFKKDKYLGATNIEVLGRLTLDEYSKQISTSKIGVSLMVSPHPSYPPLEMAAGGMSVVTNDYENKKLSAIHSNIHSIDGFNAKMYADKITELANKKGEENTHQSYIDWFFNGKSNIEQTQKEINKALLEIFKNISSTSI